MSLKFNAGSIYHVDEYTFDDDGSSKRKFMIVLHCNDDSTIILDCLTTSLVKGTSKRNYGCNKENLIYYFVFPQGEKLDDSFSFKSDTFVFFQRNIREDKIEKFKKSDVKTDLVATIPANKFRQLLKCLIQSRLAPRNTLDRIKETQSLFTIL